MKWETKDPRVLIKLDHVWLQLASLPPLKSAENFRRHLIVSLHPKGNVRIQAKEQPQHLWNWAKKGLSQTQRKDWGIKWNHQSKVTTLIKLKMLHLRVLLHSNLAKRKNVDWHLVAQGHWRRRKLIDQSQLKTKPGSEFRWTQIHDSHKIAIIPIKTILLAMIQWMEKIFLSMK